MQWHRIASAERCEVGVVKGFLSTLSSRSSPKGRRVKEGSGRGRQEGTETREMSEVVYDMEL